MTRHTRTILRADELESRLTPTSFTLRALDHETSWSDPRSWDDDPAATAVPGRDDSVFVDAGSYSLDLGGGVVVVRNFTTRDVESLSINGGTLRVTDSAVFDQVFATDPMFLRLASAGIVTGGGAAAPGTVASGGGYLEMENVRLQPGLATVAGQAVFSGVMAETVTVAPTGRMRLTGGILKTLTNHGQLDGQAFTADEVRNDGTLRADGFTIGAGLINHGTLALQVLTDGHGRATHVSYPFAAVTADFTTGPDATVQIAGVNFQGVTGQLLRVTGRATLDGTLSVMGVAVGDEANPQAATLITQSHLTGRFREIVTPQTTSDPWSTGQSFLFSDKIVGLDYEADRVSLSLINNPVGLDRKPLNMGSSAYYIADAAAELGDTATFAEQYYDTRDPHPPTWDGLSTETILPNAYNINVEGTNNGLLTVNTYGPIEALDPSVWYGHQYVPDWYSDTIASPLLPPSLATTPGGYWGHVRAPEFSGVFPSHDSYPRGADYHLTIISKQQPTDTPSGTAVGGGGTVTVVSQNGQVAYSLSPFGPDFTGDVRTATADLNGDGEPDVIAGTGPGLPTRVVVIDGRTRAVLFDLAPFESAFTGGVYVAAGDLTGDGIADLAISPDEGGGPRVRVFSGNGFGQVADFFGIDDPAFRGGARVAVGDIDADGVGDLIVAAGFGGGPRVAGYSGQSLASGPIRVFADFMAFETGLRNGTFVAVGDVNGDGKADLVAGGGPGGGPRVSVFDGADLRANTQTRMVDFFAGDVSSRGGVRVAVKNLDGDNRADIVTGTGGRVVAYTGASLSGDQPPEAFTLDVFPGLIGGVFVA